MWAFSIVPEQNTAGVCLFALAIALLVFVRYIRKHTSTARRKSKVTHNCILSFLRHLKWYVYFRRVVLVAYITAYLILGEVILSVDKKL